MRRSFDLSALSLIPAVLLICLAISDTSAQSYWCPPDVLPTQFQLNDVVYVEDTTFVAVGRDGIIRSTDGGLTWTPVSVPGEELMSVSFAGPAVGFAVGKNGVVRRTADGGLNWERCGENINVTLTAVSLSGTMTGTAVAGNGNIYYTIDGGEIWSLHEASVSIWLSDIDFMDQSVGMIIGNGAVLRTEDGGTSWQSIPFSKPAFFTSICVVDSLRCFAGGSFSRESDPWHVPIGFVDRSEDGGSTWNRYVQGLGIINAIAFADADHGLAVGGYVDVPITSLVRFTSNGGDTWNSILEYEPGPNLRGVAYDQNDLAIAVGSLSNVLLDRHCLELDLDATPDYGAIQLEWTIGGLGAFDALRLLRTNPDLTETWIPSDGSFPDTTRFWFDEGLESATKYAYTVIAFYGPNETARSAPVVVTTLEDPALSLNATPGPGLVRLNWTISPVWPADGVRLLRVNPDDSESWIPEDTTFEKHTLDWVDDNVVPGLVYRYSLVAYPRPGYRVQSQEVVASPFGSVDVITEFWAEPFTDQIRLYWEFAPDFAGDVTGIRLLREQSGSDHVWLPADHLLYRYERRYVDATVTPGNEYRYTLKVWLSPDGSIESDPLVVSSIAVPVITRFNARLLESGTGVRIEWDVDSEGSIRGYQIRKSCSDGSLEWIPADTTLGPAERSVTDLQVTAGNTYSYRLYILLTAGGNTVSDPQTIFVEPAPTATFLGQNHPNPFNPGTSIPYGLTEYSRVTIEVFDAAGRKVKTVLDGYRDKGYRSEVWDGLNDYGAPAPSGIYFYRLQAGNYTATRKMVLLR